MLKSTDAQYELKTDRRTEITILEQFQIDNRIGVSPLPPDKKCQRCYGQQKRKGNGAVTEPVLLLPFVEHELQAANAHRDQAQAHFVDGIRFCPLFHQVGRVLDHAVAEHQGKNADRQVDEEDPVPVEVVSDPPSQRRSDGRRSHDGHAVKSEGLSSLLHRKRICQDGLFAGGQPAAAQALQNAGQNQNWQGGSKAAKQRADGKQGHARHVETLAAKAGRKPAGDGQNDGARHQVAGQDPGSFLLAGAQRSCHMG